jgi:hypothetical protein
MSVVVLSLIFGWAAELIGAFLCGNFKKEEKIYTGEGFEHYYQLGWLLIFLQIIYGLKQSAMALFVESEKALDDMDYEQSKAAPCLYFS